MTFRQRDELAKLDFLIDCKRVVLEALDSRGLVKPKDILAICINHLTQSLQRSEEAGELDPNEAETLLELGREAMSSCLETSNPDSRG